MARNDIAAACAAIILHLIIQRRRRRRKKHLMQELRLGDRSGYSKFLRMDPESFGLLESLVAPFISRKIRIQALTTINLSKSPLSPSTIQPPCSVLMRMPCDTIPATSLADSILCAIRTDYNTFPTQKVSETWMIHLEILCARNKSFGDLVVPFKYACIPPMFITFSLYAKNVCWVIPTKRDLG